jgi:glucan phosphoethanolaminetransferase (alkaline phosphatase superfamily)
MIPIKSTLRYAAGVAVFGCSYLLINYTQLLHKVYYRYASAGDIENALINLASFSIQGLMLLIACVYFNPAMMAALCVVVSISSLVHLSYSQILGGNIDLSAMTWMLGEARQASNAILEFLPAVAMAVLKVSVAVGLLFVSRALLRPSVLRGKKAKSGTVKASIVAVTVGVALLAATLQAASLPQANETSAYALAARAFFETHPNRLPVDVEPDKSRQPIPKIVWLIDESVSAEGAAVALADSIKKFQPIDFGEVASMGNCSASSNAALRWGVDVLNVDNKTDLRITPTIWGYAKKAGYRTTLIDGQVTGPPQNMVWAPERQLIDDFYPEGGGIDTDSKIAGMVNKILNRPGLDFVYVVLRGAHYAYESNYPKGNIDQDATLKNKYIEAIRYSKSSFFERIFQSVDRENVFAIYTSDHGQDLTPGRVPHCNLKPNAAEFSVPLLIFSSKRMGIQLGMLSTANDLTGRSHSQIFPSSIVMMGYPPSHAMEKYDMLLNEFSKRYVWFDRSMIPSGMDTTTKTPFVGK